jgi:hypothetical protein
MPGKKKTKFDKSIEEALNLPVEPDEILDPIDQDNNSMLSGATKSIVLEDETEVNSDFQYARENLYKVSELGNKALESMIDIAQSSEHPRAFEVLATLMKQMTDAQKDLLTLREKQNRITGKTQEQPNSVTNALFVGSTAELQKMLKKNDNESNS